jgi:ubiquinone biosynthesis protein UbiJ
MSNAKVASLIADASRQTIEDISAIVLPMTEDLAATIRHLIDVQHVIAPMAEEIAALKQRVDRLEQGAGVPPS